MSMFDAPRLLDHANDDGEFRVLARSWNATIRLAMGDVHLRLLIRDGRLAAVEPWDGGDACDLTIMGPADGWAEMLAPTPKPFYHDLFAAAVHHGFFFLGDVRHRCAYYPAVRRLVELMREVRNA
jgi:hypothetical protein